jgi:hypothetical protein
MEGTGPIARHHFTVNPPTKSHPMGSEQRVNRCLTAVMELPTTVEIDSLEGSTLAGFGLPVSAHEHLDIWQRSERPFSPITEQPKPSGVHLVWQINRMQEQLANGLRPPVQRAGLSMLPQGYGSSFLIY